MTKVISYRTSNDDLIFHFVLLNVRKTPKINY